MKNIFLNIARKFPINLGMYLKQQGEKRFQVFFLNTL